MTIIESIAWASVELSAATPDLKAIREALDRALVDAARLELSHEVRKNSLIRLTQAVA